MDRHRQAAAIAQAVAAALPARAVALTGSVAAGTDHPDSDIDLVAVTDTVLDDDVRSVDGRMVTIAWTTPARIESSFTAPWEAPVAVPTWRRARALADPEGLIAGVRASAQAWEWALIAEAADRWAAESLVGLAEEVHKVSGMLSVGNARAAAANRGILALRLPGIMAAADRILYRTENELWDLVCESEGTAWARAWDAATGVTPADLASSCRGALRLYRLAADRVGEALDPAQRPVVALACRLAAAA